MTAGAGRAGLYTTSGADGLRLVAGGVRDREAAARSWEWPAERLSWVPYRRWGLGLGRSRRRSGACLVVEASGVGHLACRVADVAELEGLTAQARQEGRRVRRTRREPR